MIVFYVIVGISALGVGAVFFLLSKEKSEGDETVEPFPLDSLKERGPMNLSKKALLEPEIEAPKKKSNPFANFKMPGKKNEAEAPAEDAFEPKAKKPKFKMPDVLSKLKGGLSGLKKKKSDSEDDDLEQESSAKKNPLQGILSKLKFGKKKAKDDDVQPTNFASLKEKLNQFSKGAEKEVDDKPLPLRKDTGTSSLKTLQEKPEAISLSDQEKESIEHEVGEATELAELKSKYSKMENLLSEKNSELEKNKTSFDSEVGHRKDFNKIKDLLEKELKEVKERVKTVRQDHANAVQEKDNALRRIKQLEEKSTKLEKEILGLEKENDTLRRQMKQAGLKDIPIPRIVVPVAEETPEAAPAAEPPPPAPAPAAAAPMDLPPAFREVQTKAKMSKEDISKFEESLGFSSHEVAAEAPLTPAPVPAPEPEPLMEEPPKPIEEPPAAVVEPPAAVVETPAAPPVAEAPVVEPPVTEPAIPEPSAPEPPAPAFEEPTPPERDDDDDDQESGGSFLKLSPDPMSGPTAPKAPQEPSPDKPEDKKE